MSVTLSVLAFNNVSIMKCLLYVSLNMGLCKCSIKCTFKLEWVSTEYYIPEIWHWFAIITVTQLKYG